MNERKRAQRRIGSGGWGYVSLGILALFTMLWPVQVFSADEAATGIRVVCDRWPDAGTPATFGRDSARLADAGHPEEEAIAVWRYLQQVTSVGRQVPKEPAYGNKYVVAPEKLLNVYGVHWCDGLSRLMTMTWRALGYRADKLYKFGHTLANCWWRDRDGIMRDHVFDLSQHWYVFDRSGSHIAGADELVLDHSLQAYPSRTPVPLKSSPLKPSYVHAGHLKLKPHPMGWNLRRGEMVVMQWRNEGRPYYDLYAQVGKKRDFEHGPYPLTYGNGRLLFRPVLTGEDIFRAASRHEHLEPGAKGLQLTEGQEAGEAVIPFALPYILADVQLSLEGQLSDAGDAISVSLSTDGGKSWREVWSAAGKENFHRDNLSIAPDFNPAKAKRVSEITPFGRYDYLLKVTLRNQDSMEPGPNLKRLEVKNIFQHNIFALPMLWPGENRISVDGNTASDTSLKIVYLWDDDQGKERRREMLLSQLPATFSITAKGNKWQDVRSRALTIEVVDAPKRSHRTESAKQEHSAAKPATALPYPTQRSIGSRSKELLSFSRASADLEKALKKRNASVIADRLVALAALQDPRSEEILQRVILEDRSAAVWHKELACQALYQSIGKEAAPFLMRIIERDPSIAWRAPRGRWPEDAMWLHTMAIASAILGDIGDFPQKERAADLIAATLRGEMTRVPLRKLHRGGEVTWGLIRNLGRLGGPRHVELLVSFLPEKADAAAVAAEALVRIGDADLLPRFIALAEEAKYPPLRVAAIRGIGKFGSAEHADILRPFLDHWDEDFRGAAARGLGALGGVEAMEDLEAAMKEESFPWVREVIRESIARISEARHT